MKRKLCATFVLTLAACLAAGAEPAKWAKPDLPYRITVTRPTPWRDEGPRPVEVAVDFPLLLKRAGFAEGDRVSGIRVVERRPDGAPRDVPCAERHEPDTATGERREYLTWWAGGEAGNSAAYDLYFALRRGAAPAPGPAPDKPPPENLLRNARFSEHADGGPAHWDVTGKGIVRVGRESAALKARPLKIVVDEKTPRDAPREVTISQKFDVARFAGCEMVFECDLLAERAAYGAPVSIEIRQFRKDASRIREFAVQPRWTTIELAEGHVVRLRQRGRFSHDAATAEVHVRVRCGVRDADTRAQVTGPESYVTVCLDRMVVRPGERWPWPPASGAGFVDGAMTDAPRNRAFEFTGRRRVAFNGASEGTLTGGKYGRASSVHWGPAAGTLEFWACPKWSAGDGAEHTFFAATSYGHRLHSRLRKRSGAGRNRLEFTIADAGGTRRTVSGKADLKAGTWRHIAATWDFRRAHVQLFVDGRRIAAEGPGKKPWPWSTIAVGGKKKTPGIGISQSDTRSLPMQAFIGGDIRCRSSETARAVLDEVRISDVARYGEEFLPARKEFVVDAHTRALWHFEGGVHGVHHGDDRFVRGHLACERSPLSGTVALESLVDGKVRRREVSLRPGDLAKRFKANRAESRLPVHRRLRKLPDPRFVAFVPRQVERVLAGEPAGFELTVGGDLEPLMRATTFEHAAAPAKTTPLPRWRANDNVVPFSVADLAATLAPEAPDRTARALAAFGYALQATNYYDAHYCESLPGRHRSRVSYTLTKALNIYPFDQCGPLNYALRKLFLAVGVSSNDASGTHHQFEQAYFDGGWRLFDLSPRVYWLRRDNQTVASRREFEEDLYLKLRQGSGVTSALRGRPSRARFGSAVRPHRMDFPMQPGERVSVCWHNEGRWFELTGSRKPIPLAKIPPMFGNGSIVYRPGGGADGGGMTNLAVSPGGAAGAALSAKDGAKAAALVYRCRCPYILSDARVSGAYRGGKGQAVALLLSTDGGRKWKDVWRGQGKQGMIAADLRKDVSARYEYHLKLALQGGSDASVRGLTVRTTFVVSPLSLPGRLSLGKNRIRFVGGPPAAGLRTTCRWIERHRSKLGVGIDGIGYYLDGGRAHRSVIVARPGEKMPVRVALTGPAGKVAVTLEGLPDGWLTGPAKATAALAGGDKPAAVTFSLAPKGEAGEVRGFAAAIGADGKAAGRCIWGQVLLADAPLVREAEAADRRTGKAAAAEVAEASGRRVVAFRGDGKLAFDLSAPRAGTYALWLRARWRAGGNTAMTLAIDKAKPRRLGVTAMIGFSDWTSTSRAHTKMFAHYGEQYDHWSWYRIPAVKLTAGKRRLTLGAGTGARIDALVLLPQTPAVDRAAMNLFQNWNYAPWLIPM